MVTVLTTHNIDRPVGAVLTIICLVLIVGGPVALMVCAGLSRAAGRPYPTTPSDREQVQR